MSSGWILIIIVAAAVALTLRARMAGRNATLGYLRAAWGSAPARERRFDTILSAHRSRVAYEHAWALDDRTWNDLNLDDVFAAIDRTESTLGQSALYHRLRQAPMASHLDAFEALVTRMSDDAPARERAQLAVRRLQDLNGYDLWWIGRGEIISRAGWHVVFPLLGLAAAVALAAAMVKPSLLPVFLGVMVANLVVRFTTDRRVLDLAATFRQLAPVIAAGQSLGFLDGATVSPVTTPLREDAARLVRLKTIARWVSGDPLMLSANPSGLATIVSDVVNIGYEYLNYVFLLDANGVYFGAGELAANGPALMRVLAATGDVDAAIAVASYRREVQNWSRPRTLPSGAEVTLTDARHPLVADAVPNSITLPAGRGLLVTGSNMSGKSTFVRTVGVNVVLAQTIHTCLAADYAAPILDVRSCIGRSDDLLGGKSYYLVEVESLMSLVRAAEQKAPCLFLLDEMFRGTNAVERIAAGRAVLRELIGAGDGGRNIVLAATHDGELVDLLADSYVPVHFGDTLGDDGLTFDHRVKPGRATTRNAIALLRLNGAPERLVQDALACAADLDRARQTSPLRLERVQASVAHGAQE